MNETMAFYTKAQARDICGISYAEMARREKKVPPQFPLRIALPGAKHGRVHRNSRRVYLRHEIHAWVEDQVRAARALTVSG
jgi:hypothetical protein